LFLIRTTGVYVAACVTFATALLVLQFALPPTPVAMVAGVMAGAALTPNFAACVVVWAVTAATAAMALLVLGISPLQAALAASAAAVIPAVPFYVWSKKKESPTNVSSCDKICVVAIDQIPCTDSLYL